MWLQCDAIGRISPLGAFSLSSVSEQTSLHAALLPAFSVPSAITCRYSGSQSMAVVGGRFSVLVVKSLLYTDAGLQVWRMSAQMQLLVVQ